MPYPVSIAVVPALTGRNRLTTFFRLVLAIPHIILVGGLGSAVTGRSQGNTEFSLGGEAGLLGAVAAFLAVISWFTLLFAGVHIAGIRQFTTFYLRWRLRGLAYLTLLEDAYPPFGDAPYPTSIEVADPAGPRDRLTIGFRLILAIPHIIVVVLLQLAWACTTIAAWFVILFTGAYPGGLYEFGVGVLRWRLRVEAYMLLLTDEYPPFALTES
jgi:hypothetical protein